MSKYTTGEIAKLCGVTVRTVQYYDTRGILLPSTLSEGGRRLYSEADLKRMKIICFLRNLDLPIDAISQILKEEHPEKVISLLIEQQEKALSDEISDKEKKLEKLRELNNGLKSKNKNATRGVKVEVGSEEVSVDIYLNVEYGTPIQRAAHDVQEGVKKGIESMTGLHVVRVDVHVQGVSFEKENNALQAGAGKAVLEAGEKTQEKLSEKAEKPVLAPEIPEEPIVPVQAEENPEETGKPSGAVTEEMPEEGMEDILSEETKTDE